MNSRGSPRSGTPGSPATNHTHRDAVQAPRRAPAYAHPATPPPRLIDLGGGSNSARIVSEIVYDAYGRVLAREDRGGTTPPDLRLGHKGLFFDRLDGGIADPLSGADTRRLESGSRLLGFVRNRTLHTQWGRFLQRDPNATGVVVQALLPVHGERLFAEVQGFDLNVHLEDSVSIQSYVNNNAILSGDQTGLFIGFSGAAMGAAFGMWETVEGAYASARQGADIYMGARGMISSYAAFQEADAEWATDWSIDDEGSSHSMIFARGIGVWADQESSSAFESDGLVMAGRVRLGGAQNRATYESNRSRWDSVRRSFWRAEARRKTGRMNNWSESDLARMRKGLSPEGWIIHHRRPLAHGGSNNRRNLVLSLTSTHRGSYGSMHTPPYALPGRLTRPLGPQGPGIIRPRRGL